MMKADKAVARKQRETDELPAILPPPATVHEGKEGLQSSGRKLLVHELLVPRPRPERVPRGTVCIMAGHGFAVSVTEWGFAVSLTGPVLALEQLDFAFLNPRRASLLPVPCRIGQLLVLRRPERSSQLLFVEIRDPKSQSVTNGPDTARSVRQSLLVLPSKPGDCDQPICSPMRPSALQAAQPSLPHVPSGLPAPFFWNQSQVSLNPSSMGTQGSHPRVRLAYDGSIALLRCSPNLGGA